MASNRWDSLLSDSTWYVPAANLLAYRLDSSSTDTPIPAADQTIWSIGKAIDGRFSGRSVAKIVDATGTVNRAFNTMEGVVTETGQARITFTSPIGSTVTGIGQVRRVNGVEAMEMQMITGGGGSYTTHWAYMLPLTDSTTPPDPATDLGEQTTYRSTQYNWLRGTSWTLRSHDANRSNVGGSFTIDGYRNGYFWGEGQESGSKETFQVLGSITPEGNFFLNAIDSDDFELRLSQGGPLLGDRREALALLRPYTNTSGQFGEPVQLRHSEIARSRDLITEGGDVPTFALGADELPFKVINRLVALRARSGGFLAEPQPLDPNNPRFNPLQSSDRLSNGFGLFGTPQGRQTRFDVGDPFLSSGLSGDLLMA
jgi:hypothetical protein